MSYLDIFCSRGSPSRYIDLLICPEILEVYVPASTAPPPFSIDYLAKHNSLEITQYNNSYTKMFTSHQMV